MSELSKRVSYLQGLIEGMEISENTKEGKAIKVISEVLKEMVQTIEQIIETQEDMQDYIDSIDEDLSDIEEEVYGEDFVTVECPHCGESFQVESSIMEDPDSEIVCPECGETFTPDDVEWIEGLEEDEGKEVPVSLEEQGESEEDEEDEDRGHYGKKHPRS